MPIFAALISLQTAKPVTQPTLTYYQNVLVLREKGRVLRFDPQRPAAATSPAFVAFRRAKTWVVWDDRGLTVRTGKRVRSTRLEDLPTSPKVQERADLVQTVSLIRQGVRNRRASGLSGARRFGSYVYLVPRWADRDGTWLETLIRVDLEKPFPKPEFLARIEGESLATAPLEDRLIVRDGVLSLAVRRGKDWGFAEYDVKTAALGFRPVGGDLRSLTPDGRFVEKTPYATFLAGILDYRTLERRVVAETRKAPTWLDGEDPGLLTDPSGNLRNAETGVVAPLPPGARIARMARDRIVVWTGSPKPTRATVHDADTLKPVASWRG